jgi:acyl-CoA dehydrogenase
MAHDFAENEIRPIAWELDREGAFPHAIITKAHALGLMNIHVPEELGGAGIGYLEGAILEEELAWGCSGVQTSLGGNNLALTPLMLAGSPQLQRRYLERVVAEPALVSFCLTEPDAGSDVAAIKTRAVRRGESYVISGSKCFITNGSHAAFFIVFAKTDAQAGHRGLSCFVVPREAGVIVDGHEDKMGQRASDTATITFPDVEIPADHLIGAESDGFKLAMMTLDRTRPGVAAMATGIARAALEFALAYAQERVQFGVPIIEHQAIQFILADIATDVEASRLLAWKSAVAIDQGQRNTLVSAHAKRFAADAAMRAATDAVQVFGGYGFIKDYPVEKFYRDVKLCTIGEGTSEIQRLVIAREILNK